MWLSKKELLVTTNHDTYIKVMNRLKEANIDFHIKTTFPHMSAVPVKQNMAAVDMERVQHLGDYSRTYYIYVKNKDFDEAVFVMNKED